MLNAKYLCCGQCGNKMGIELIERGIAVPQDVILLNTTLKDIPEKYRDLGMKIEGSEGCGKERNIANQLTKDALQNNTIQIDEFIDEDTDIVIIATSTSGGTGSGASIMLANYVSNVLEKNVHLFACGGFMSDARELKNTVEWFKDCQKDVVVEAIRNDKFLSVGGKSRAEKAANEEFCERVKVLLGKVIVESDTNIDDTDLLKVSTTPGFMTIEHGEIGKPKNIEEFDKAVAKIIDDSKSFTIDPSTATRLAVILNIDPRIGDNIDYQFEAIKKRLASTPFEVFTHVQNVEGIGNYIWIISSGLKMPIEDIEEMYEDFTSRMNAVDRSKDEFFGKAFDTSSDDFDMGISRGNKKSNVAKKKAAFFDNDFVQNPEQKNSGKFISEDI